MIAEFWRVNLAQLLLLLLLNFNFLLISVNFIFIVFSSGVNQGFLVEELESFFSGTWAYVSERVLSIIEDMILCQLLCQTTHEEKKLSPCKFNRKLIRAKARKNNSINVIMNAFEYGDEITREARWTQWLARYKLFSAAKKLTLTEYEVVARATFLFLIGTDAMSLYLSVRIDTEE